MKINSCVIRDSCISLGEADIPVFSGCEPPDDTQVCRSSIKAKFYCFCGSMCTLKMKDDNFSDVIDTKETAFILNLLLFFTSSRSMFCFHFMFLVLSSSEGYSQNHLD